jgi:hypothetical protein
MMHASSMKNDFIDSLLVDYLHHEKRSSCDGRVTGDCNINAKDPINLGTLEFR